ncbi:MAG: hypothetical protein JKY23_00800 [Nitrospinaceae bacterium]|nr:hypothetical protein [Nitrospinaceae bacterium]
MKMRRVMMGPDLFSMSWCSFGVKMEKWQKEELESAKKNHCAHEFKFSFAKSNHLKKSHNAIDLTIQSFYRQVC